MDELDHDLRTRTDDDQARDRAIRSFLNLGEKLKAFAGRRTQERRKLNAEDSLGASALFDTIEGEIIPRLMLAHRRAPANGDKETPVNLVTQQDHEAFLHCVLNESASSAGRFANELLQRGVSREDLFLDLLATSARRLGEMWERDDCDFTDVTIGLCRLHEVVRENAANANYSPRQSAVKGPRILLATACGDQHVFGVVIVADFFRRSGWRVTSEPGASRDHIAKILSQCEYDVLGLSAACSIFANDIADEIKVFRAASRNDEIKILAGGRLFFESPELVEEVGADGYAGDAKLAIEIGQNLLAADAGHC